MSKDDDRDDLQAFRIGPFTLIELMAVLAVLGIFLAWLLPRFFM